MQQCQFQSPPSGCTPPSSTSTIFQCSPGQNDTIDLYSPCYQGQVSYQNVNLSNQNLYSVNIPPTFASQVIAIPVVFKTATPILNFVIASAPIPSGSFIGSRQDTVNVPPVPLTRISLTGSIPNQFSGQMNQTNTYLYVSDGNDYNGPTQSQVQMYSSRLALNNNYIFYLTLASTSTNMLQIQVTVVESTSVNLNFQTIGTQTTATVTVPLPPGNSFSYYVTANDMNPFAITLGKYIYTQPVAPCGCYVLSEASGLTPAPFVVQQVGSGLDSVIASNRSWKFASHRFQGLFPSSFGNNNQDFGFNVLLTSSPPAPSQTFLQFTDCPPFSTSANFSSNLVRFMIGLQRGNACTVTGTSTPIPSPQAGKLYISMNSGSESAATFVTMDVPSSSSSFVYDIVVLEDLVNAGTFYGMVKLAASGGSITGTPGQASYLDAISGPVFVSPVVPFRVSTPSAWKTTNAFVNVVNSTNTIQCFYGLGPLNLEFMSSSATSLPSLSGCGSSMICTNNTQVTSSSKAAFATYPSPSLVSPSAMNFTNQFLQIQGTMKDWKADSAIVFSPLAFPQWTEQTTSGTQSNYLPCCKVYMSPGNFAAFSDDGTDNFTARDNVSPYAPASPSVTTNVPFTILIDFDDSVVFVYMGELVDPNSATTETVPVVLSGISDLKSLIGGGINVFVFATDNVDASTLTLQNNIPKTAFPVLDPDYNAFLARIQCPPDVTNTNYCVPNFDPSSGTLILPSAGADGTVGIFAPVSTALTTAMVQNRNPRQVLQEIGVSPGNNFIGPNLCPNGMDICVPEFVRRGNIALNNANMFSPCPARGYFSGLDGKPDNCAITCYQNYSKYKDTNMNSITGPNGEALQGCPDMTCSDYLKGYKGIDPEGDNSEMDNCLGILSDSANSLANNAPTPAFCSLYGTQPMECTSSYITSKCVPSVGGRDSFSTSMLTDTFAGVACASNLNNEFVYATSYECGGEKSPWSNVFSNLYQCNSLGTSNPCTKYGLVENQYGVCVVPPPTFTATPTVSAFQLCGPACSSPSSSSSSSLLAPNWSTTACSMDPDTGACTASMKWTPPSSFKNSDGSTSSLAMGVVYPQVCSTGKDSFGIQMVANMDPSPTTAIGIETSTSFLTGGPTTTSTFVGIDPGVSVPDCLGSGSVNDPTNPVSWNMANLFDASFYTDAPGSVPFQNLYNFPSTITDQTFRFLPNLF